MYQDINCSESLTIMVYNTNIIGPLELHDHSFIDWSCILHLCTVAQTTVSPEYLYIIIVLKIIYLCYTDHYQDAHTNHCKSPNPDTFLQMNNKMLVLLVKL